MHLQRQLLTMALLAAVMAGPAEGTEQTHWGYSGAIGPEHWGELSQEYRLCSTGKNQSPVNLVGALDAELAPLELHYAVEVTEIVNNGHTIQLTFAAGGDLVIDQTRYGLRQIHFHSPSENTIDGRAYPLEGHLVHADEQGRLAVVAVMYEEGPEHAALTRAWQQIPTEADGRQPIAGALNAESFLPAKRSYFRFNGSLTTPPCTEGVTWLVLTQPATVSRDQVNSFLQVMGGPNNRPVQPLKARIILK